VAVLCKDLPGPLMPARPNGVYNTVGSHGAHDFSYHEQAMRRAGRTTWPGPLALGNAYVTDGSGRESSAVDVPEYREETASP
jgi:hypothetical protein